MSDLAHLTNLLVRFREERNWQQFHNPKDLATALSIEAGELLEAYLWKKPEEASVDKVKEELADILAYALLLAHHYGLDIREIVQEKIRKNAEKYPVDKSKGTAAKYDEL
jgi:NTP pyrophosphatase (non-canonical NTP hydrolase)